MRNPSENNSGGVQTFLPWLIAMGADEIILETPVNRLQSEADRPVAHVPIAHVLASVPAATEQEKTDLTRSTAWPRSASASHQVAAAEATSQSAEVLAASADSLEDLRAAFASFHSHPLARTATRMCFLSGAVQSRVLVFSDKPRNDEDPLGDVLAGKHRVLAERMLSSIGLCGMETVDGHEQVMLASFVPWRPPGNRGLTEQEARDCLPFAQRLIALAKPSLILCFGALPGQYLAGGPAAITKARGQWLTVNGIPLLTTFHPETLLKSPHSKRLAWHDLLSFKAKLESLP